MAQIFPSEENISRLKVQPTEGERYLLNSLQENLDDRFEIYYQPFLNGDQPDIIVMRKNSGVLIIEVKDWDLSSYYVDNQKQWKLEKNDSTLKSPIEQVKTYKNNLFDLHIENLLEKQIGNTKLYGIVSCAVYFHKENETSLNIFLDNAFESENDRKYIKVFGRDSLNPQKIRIILSQTKLYQSSSFFDEQIYNSFKRYLQPPFHTIEQGIEINLTAQQKKLTVSKSPSGKKIKGVAGSGKTLILARRAVNAHKRTGKKVLILTYNITLKNYIHDKISEVREEFTWDSFYINNYHSFIGAELNNLGIKIITPLGFDTWSSDEKTKYFEENYYSNEKLFEEVKHRIKKYSVILIDEFQDYKEEWQKNIRKYFLDKDGEYVVFGDVKQNIYKRALDEYKDFKAIGIPGAWNKLKESFRLSKKTADIAEKFQEFIFKEKYTLDKIENLRERNIFDNEQELFHYIYFDKTTSLNSINNAVYSQINEFQIHPNNICFLSHTVEIVREIDYCIRHYKHEQTQVMFETQEIYEEIMSSVKNKNDLRIAKSKIEKIRRNKKFHFWMNPGMVKLSTIHSFKGWEIHTLVLILENYAEDSDSTFSFDELIYTGITRCRHNLIVVNLGNLKYHDFFNQVIGDDRNLNP